MRFALIKAGLAVHSDDSSDGFSAHGAFSEGMIMFATKRRDEAIRFAQDFFRAAVPLLLPQLPEAVEIAYLNADEDSWFTVQPQQDRRPFARWLTDELSRERSRMNREAVQDMTLFIHTMSRGLQPPSDLAQ